jgi:pyruvate formate lyase activating enzyme
VDTSGLAPLADLLAVADHTDLFLFDIKLMDERRHREHTGISNAAILANLEALALCHPAIWLRLPVIPGVNDDDENLEATAALAASMPAVRQVCLLPYHRLGTEKLRRLEEGDAGWRAQTPSSESLRALASRLEAAGVRTRIGD